MADGWIDEWTNEWMDGWIYKVDGRMNGWKDG